MRPTWIRTVILSVFRVGVVWLVGVPAGTAEDAGPGARNRNSNGTALPSHG